MSATCSNPSPPNRPTEGGGSWPPNPQVVLDLKAEVSRNVNSVGMQILYPFPLT